MYESNASNRQFVRILSSECVLLASTDCNGKRTVGAEVGIAVDTTVGCHVSVTCVGPREGATLGDHVCPTRVGPRVIGAAVGAVDGLAVVGAMVDADGSTTVGASVGALGAAVGDEVVGLALGEAVVGECVGD